MFDWELCFHFCEVYGFRNLVGLELPIKHTLRPFSYSGKGYGSMIMDINYETNSFFPIFWSVEPRGISLQKISYAFGKNAFVCKKNPSKIRKNPFVLKKSRTLFRRSEMPLELNILPPSPGVSTQSMLKSQRTFLDTSPTLNEEERGIFDRQILHSEFVSNYFVHDCSDDFIHSCVRSKTKYI